MRFDAAIVGGGAAGSMLAWKLAEKGWKVIIFERRGEAGGKVCGGLVSHRVIKFSGTEAVMKEIKGARVVFPGGKELIIGGDKTHAYVLERDEFDREMMEKAMAAGAEYMKFDVKRIKNGRIEGMENIKFDYIVGADGAKSTIAKHYNMGEVELIKAIQGYWDGGGRDDDYVTIYFDNRISPGFFSWTIPDGEKLRVGLGSMKGKMKERLHMLEKRMGLEIKKARGGVIPVGMRKFYRENVALIGDAAGQVKATSGGGLYAITVAASSLSETFPDFGKYRRKFMEKFGREIKKTLMARKIFLKMKNEDIDQIAEMLQKDVDMINKHGDLDYQSRVGKEFLKRHFFTITKLGIKKLFI